MGLSALRVLSFVGLFLCAYALYVEYKVATEVSCSKVFSSEYAYDAGLNLGLHIPNAAYGSGFYGVVLVLDSMKLYQYVVYLSSLTFISTLYLAYILAFVLKDLCVVCVSTYIVNATIFFVARYYANTSGKRKNM